MRWGALPFALLGFLVACSQPEATPESSEATAPADIVIDEAQRARVAQLAQTWAAEPSYIVSFNALSPDTPLSLAQPSSGPVFDPNDAHYGLPEDENRIHVESYCAACHSVQLVMQHRMDRAGWDATLTRMVTLRGMPELRADIREGALTYLTEYFGSASQP
jgi:hypothetical protein